MKYFLFGLQRSGTNFLEQIIRNNFGGNRVNRGHQSWKHSIDKPRGYDPNIYTIIMYKNPYTWAESLCFRNTVDWNKSQKTYPVLENISSELQVGSRKYNIVNLAKTYKHWCDTWIETPPTNSILFSYEDLLIPEKRETILNSISANFIKRKHNHWIIPQRGKVSQSNDYTEDREKYYLNMKPDKLSKDQTNAITSTITTNMIEKLGYVPKSYK